VVKQTLRPSVALINDAALHIVRVVRASSICGRPLVFFACRRRNADAVFFVLPCGFASGAAAIEGGERRQGEQKHERKGFVHFGSVVVLIAAASETMCWRIHVRGRRGLKILYAVW